MRVGTLVELSENINEKFEELRLLGMECCQLLSWNEDYFTEEMAERVKEATKKHKVDVTAFWCGWPGPKTWDFYDGQLTLGLIPKEFRNARLKTLLHGSDFARKMHIRDFVTHVGYLPENPYDKNYKEVIEALKQLANRCKTNGQNFLFETGQETPVTLLRAIEDIGSDNLGINLDPANLIMYGKANPIDSLEVFGKYVLGIHGKDGLYPTDGRRLGREVSLGMGRVNYPVLIQRLKEIGYSGDITIEREISGDEQTKDIIAAKELLEKLINDNEMII
ncbi:MAG: Xylose isomerase domain protein barrel [Herbinix sp.]|jgi:sugar phosphate isomerase/epimerase|nr:Xylose isomerase domain protein barrel [Herbinix sp.]